MDELKSALLKGQQAKSQKAGHALAEKRASDSALERLYAYFQLNINLFEKHGIKVRISRSIDSTSVMLLRTKLIRQIIFIAYKNSGSYYYHSTTPGDTDIFGNYQSGTDHWDLCGDSVEEAGKDIFYKIGEDSLSWNYFLGDHQWFKDENFKAKSMVFQCIFWSGITILFLYMYIKYS